MKRADRLQLRRRARALFPACTIHMKAQWVLARLRVDSGTWKFPIGERFVDSADVPQFLRRLPPGPPLETVADMFDRKVLALRFVRGMTR